MEGAASSIDQVAQMRERLDKEGRQLVFTNGCFDLLHAGHVRYLAQARALGDALVIGLNGDESVRGLKGEGRPVHPAEDRAEVLMALEAVDAVVVFEEERATGLIEGIRPHVYAKGGDYTVESLHPEERAALEKAGTKIEILGLVPGRSTSATLKKMAGHNEGGHREAPRLAVLGSGKGSNFRAISEAIESGRLDAEIALVISDVEDSQMLADAKTGGFEAVHVPPGPTASGLSDAALKEMRDRIVAADVDLVILAGFMRILKNPILSEFEGRLINIHPSLLPKHKGLEAWTQALEAGDETAGCTVHFVTEDLDSGEIILQAEVPVLPGDTPDTLHERIQVEEHRIFSEGIAKVWAEIRARSE